ncbi:uncharacterized protein LOC115883756 [Sitophilus oryzae]|uniref:Uncharacterized protein LOC115874301 n=1 Tax=Sitophilus oryzae TaxID=7048 RepID=A0A6J2Y0Y4_SITOR|nr:uncharacterized protein LOC115874301 [Sitophilus oryzae]XP_030756690.1 uncharacterized protein LOC115882637 [Sitophilus oryzae]XP_030757276.1 uncharacterized protein LOC115883110 [Sitophilus oryzae]XP_030758025.1 uncharacterized protein LOC115883756 [Sitophilus oryzae]
MVDLSNEHLTTILETIKKSSEETSAAVTSQLKEYFKEETEKLLNKINEQAHKIEILEERCTKIEENQIKFERFIKRKNLIIFGARYNKDNNNILQFTLDLLQKYLNVQITENDIDNIYTLNNVSSKNGPPIKVEFVTNLKKNLIIGNCYKLKNTEISIAQDLSYEDRQERKILQEHLRQARAKNYSAKILSNNRLQINGDIYTTNQLKATSNEVILQEESRSLSTKPQSPNPTSDSEEVFVPASLSIENKEKSTAKFQTIENEKSKKRELNNSNSPTKAPLSEAKRSRTTSRSTRKHT